MFSPYLLKSYVPATRANKNLLQWAQVRKHQSEEEEEENYGERGTAYRLSSIVCLLI